MSRSIFLLATLLLAQYATIGQKNKLVIPGPKQLSKKEAEAEDRNHNCIKKNATSFTTRLKKYPFNLSSQVQLVSFKRDTINSKQGDIRDSLPRMNDTICYSKLYEVKNLTLVQVDQLTDILYNYGYSGPIHIGYSSNCYIPRNAILFLDNNGKVIEYIEICFECSETRQSSSKISLGDMCEQKMEMLKGFFKKVGVEYGVTK